MEEAASLRPGWARDGRLFDMVVKDWAFGKTKVEKDLATEPRTYL